MRELPILFSTPMVTAIIAGCKTVTRRAINIPETIEYPTVGKSVFTPPGQWSIRGRFTETFGEKFIKCRQGVKGDLLWVRETFFDELGVYDGESKHNYIYRQNCENYPLGSSHWKPSIFMPKEASRIWLLNEGVTAERLHHITEDQAICEGVRPLLQSRAQAIENGGVVYRNYLQKGLFSDPLTARESFRSLWILINGQESWDSNPWVFATSFKVLSINGKP